MLSRRSNLAGLALAALLALQGVSAQMHTLVETFDESCESQLELLWIAYQNPPVAPVAGCDRVCLNACYTTLHWAVYSEKQQNCPVQEDIIRCFHVYRPQWTKFVGDCALFQYGVTATAEGEGEGGGSSTTPATPSTSEGAATAEGAAAAEGAATSEGAAPAEGAATAEGAAGRRRVLLQEAEAALGSGSVNVYNGCFPNFDTVDDFEAYLNGEFQFKTSSSAVGFTLSALYFASLLLLGLGLPDWAKPWKKMSCFKRNAKQTPMLQAPATQPLTAAALDSAPDGELAPAPLAPEPASAPLATPASAPAS